ncbi:hypothetical protein GH714_013497 [Hevea brasiliensis]|uniref:Uncharacterized protein n=1 Tax=Hevea brasiliensis TaxID=3981 RepID=A0A6A6NAG8_HEVBR|nr:hypothetical protein GH714_013497 [Hevea brasiliensis]
MEGGIGPDRTFPDKSRDFKDPISKGKSNEVILERLLIRDGRVSCNELLEIELSQVTPTQLQGLLPTQESKVDWLWLLRLAFHFKRESASIPHLAGSSLFVSAEAEVAAEAEELMKKREDINMRINRLGINWKVTSRASTL